MAAGKTVAFHLQGEDAGQGSEIFSSQCRFPWLGSLWKGAQSYGSCSSVRKAEMRTWALDNEVAESRISRKSSVSS